MSVIRGVGKVHRTSRQN